MPFVSKNLPVSISISKPRVRGYNHQVLQSTNIDQKSAWFLLLINNLYVYILLYHNEPRAIIHMPVLRVNIKQIPRPFCIPCPAIEQTEQHVRRCHHLKVSQWWFRPRG